mgnify:FL=1
MDELIKWLQDIGSTADVYPDELYKTGVELCEKYSKNQAIKATFRVIRPTPLHKKLLRNTLKSTADLLERREAAGKKKADSILPPEKTKTKNPTKKPVKSKKTVSRKPTQPKKSAKGTQK